MNEQDFARTEPPTLREGRPADVPAVRILLERVIASLDIYSEAARSSEIDQYGEPELRAIAETGILVVRFRRMVPTENARKPSFFSGREGLIRRVLTTSRRGGSARRLRLLLWL